MKKRGLAKRVGIACGGGAVVLLVMAAAVPVAGARTTTGYSGNPLSGQVGVAADWSCYSEESGAVMGINKANCSGMWEVGLPIEPPNNTPYTVSFTGRGVTSRPCCQSLAVNNLGVATASAARCTVFSNYTRQTLVPVTVPPGGSLFLFCTGLTDTFTRLLSVDY
jgi:hypothetical protein